MIFFKLLSLLPLRVLYLLADLLYLLAYHIFKYRKKIIKENLKKAFPEKGEKELEEIIRKFYRNLSDLVVEIIKTLSLSEEELSKRVIVSNPEYPQTFVDSRQSLIVLTGHLCNWEWLLSACMIKFKYPIDAVYKPLSSKFADKIMLTIRSKFGASPLAMKQTLREQIKKKNIPHGLAMVADQSPQRDEIQFWTRFFNQDTPYYVGADKIAKMLNLPVIFAGMKRTGRGHYEIYFREILSPPFVENGFSVTEKYNRILEEEIRKQPENWLWSHRRWKHERVTI